MNVQVKINQTESYASCDVLFRHRSGDVRTLIERVPTKCLKNSSELHYKLELAKGHNALTGEE